MSTVRTATILFPIPPTRAQTGDKERARLIKRAGELGHNNPARASTDNLRKFVERIENEGRDHANPTAQAILDHVRIHGPVDAERVASDLGLEAPTVRWWLRKLANRDLVEPTGGKWEAELA